MLDTRLQSRSTGRRRKKEKPALIYVGTIEEKTIGHLEPQRFLVYEDYRGNRFYQRICLVDQY